MSIARCFVIFSGTHHNDLRGPTTSEIKRQWKRVKTFALRYGTCQQFNLADLQIQSIHPNSRRTAGSTACLLISFWRLLGHRGAEQTHSTYLSSACLDDYCVSFRRHHFSLFIANCRVRHSSHIIIVVALDYCSSWWVPMACQRRCLCCRRWRTLKVKIFFLALAFALHSSTHGLWILCTF